MVKQDHIAHTASESHNNTAKTEAKIYLNKFVCQLEGRSFKSQVLSW